MNWSQFAKKCAEEFLPKMKPGQFKVVFDKMRRLAIVVYVLPKAKSGRTEVERMDIFAEAEGALLNKGWIHLEGAARTGRVRKTVAFASIFTTGPQNKALICEAYEKAMNKAMKLAQ